MASLPQQLTSLSATLPRMGGWSHYAGMTSAQAHDEFRRGVWRIRILAIGAFLVVAGLFLWLWDGLAWGMAAYVACVVAVAVAAIMALARNFQGLLDISNRDCDPQKLIEVVARLQEEDKRGSSANNLSLAYAVCSLNLGHDDVALQWLDQVRFRKVPPRTATTMLFIRASIALNAGDIATARGMRDEIGALRPSGKVSAERDLALSMLDARLALASGDVDAAREQVVRAASLGPLPVQEVAIEYLAGLVEDAAGDVDAARAHMEVVVANAGTLALGKRAREYLAGMSS